MKGSIRIATILGIPVHIHWTFFLIFVYIYALGSFSSSAPKLTASYALLIILLFTCVLLHEFGHALMARRYGVKTHDIILSPIGGIARLNRIPEKPIQEFMVAIAGPLVNVAIAILLLPFYFFTLSAVDRSNLVNSLFNSGGNYFAPDLGVAGFLIVGVFWLNIVLAIFNLLPAFPMDGGRVLRALLSLKFSRVKATRIAANIGKAFAIFFVAVGIFSQPFNAIYIFIGFFIFLTATNEYRMVRYEKVLENDTGKDLMQQALSSLQLTDPIEKAIGLQGKKRNRNFLIRDAWLNPVGVLSERQILQAQKRKEGAQAIHEFPLLQVPLASQELQLGHLFKLLGDNKFKMLVLVDKYGQATGVVDNHLVNFYMKKVSKG